MSLQLKVRKYKPMGTLISILAVLFIGLLVIVPLVEKFGKDYSKEEIQKLSRWILPLVAVLLVLQLLRMAFG